ncbi:pre-mRNA-splicing factor SPF27-like [Teleopsis dalmanni]|uniref:pre-mRNA-splicing factor SPF27-like n=1 Tax=Teleopsis dalmanni TaxID=139649 RepID=UPI0018CEDD88|nr:pre-mRNA-splicing factor SPF27-like [Teleopsis dalmanni]XP_037951310.1 pre-mRNA-splicing factor SPF27-like [Teleopsis dalmanni]
MTTNEVIVDALPYIDHGYDDTGVRESALAMVEEECRRYRPTKNYLDHLPALSTNAFETKLMSTEFERIQNRLPMETLSMKRYELPPPAAGKLSEVTAWQESIENSMAQLEHQWVRAMNLELMLDYGIESWKAYLEVFVALQAKAQAQLQYLKKEIQDINWKRKLAQTSAGEKLRNLEANWVLLVSKNYEIEQHCADFEEKVQKARTYLEQLQKQVAELEMEKSAAQIVEEAHSTTQAEEEEEEDLQQEMATDEQSMEHMQYDDYNSANNDDGNDDSNAVDNTDNNPADDDDADADDNDDDDDYE